MFYRRRRGREKSSLLPGRRYVHTPGADEEEDVRS